MDLIKRLEAYRLKNRITQERLAEMLGVSFATVNRWFNGKTRPSKIQEYHIEKILSESNKRNYKIPKEKIYFSEQRPRKR